MEQVDVVVVGGGHAGLATAAQLKHAGVSCVVLEGSPRVGNSWWKRYNRLHLHTPKVVSSLPFFKLPPSYPMYPSKEQVIGYLAQYAAQLDLPVRLRHHVTGVKFDESTRLYTTSALVWEEGADEPAGGYTAPSASSSKTRAVTFTSKAVVLATGPESVPIEATLPGQAQFQGAVVHSTRYKDGKDFKGKRVLVVGSGNSGGEISLCLSEHGAQPTMLIRSHVSVVKVDDGALTGLLAKLNLKETLRPYIKWVDKLAALVAILMAPNLRGYGVPQVVPGLGGVKGLMENLHDLNAPWVDIGQGPAIQKGAIKVQLGELRGFTTTGVLIAPPLDKSKMGAGGWGPPQEHPYDAVVLCTGYDRTASFSKVLSPELLAKVLPPGTRLPPSGVAVPGQPGLFLVGWDDMFSRICMIGQESAAVAKAIKKQLAATG